MDDPLHESRLVGPRTAPLGAIAPFCSSLVDPISGEDSLLPPQKCNRAVHVKLLWTGPERLFAPASGPLGPDGSGRPHHGSRRVKPILWSMGPSSQFSFSGKFRSARCTSTGFSRIVQIVFTAGETKKPTRKSKVKSAEKQFVVRIQTSRKVVGDRGSNRRSTKEVPTSLPLYQLHQRSGSLHISILFYDSAPVSIFFSRYRLGSPLNDNDNDKSTSKDMML